MYTSHGTLRSASCRETLNTKKKEEATDIRKSVPRPPNIISHIDHIDHRVKNRALGQRERTRESSRGIEGSAKRLVYPTHAER